MGQQSAARRRPSTPRCTALSRPRTWTTCTRTPGIAFATAADSEALTAECFGDRVAWVPWRRPGFQLGLDIAAIKRDHPAAIGVILGGHGITAWGDTSDECEAHSLEIIAAAQKFIDERGTTRPFGEKLFQTLPETERRARAAALAPVIRGLASTDRRQLGHYTDHPAVLEFTGSEKLSALAALGTSCPDHFLRTKVRPMVVDLPPSAPLEAVIARLRELHALYRADYQAYYERYADASSPPMRGADPAIVLVPGVGMFSFGADKQTARVAGEFYLNAINVMRGAEAISTYAPIPEREKFRIEYWELEEAKLRRRPAPQPLAGRVAFVTGGGSGIGRATAERLAREGACVVVADRYAESAGEVAAGIGSADAAVPVTADVTSEDEVAAAFAAAALAFGGVDLVVNNAGLSISKPLAETSVADWDLLHDVMARGSFLVSRSAAAMLEAQGLGGDIVYIVSKNAVFAGPSNVAYGAAKADQAHQVRLLAAEPPGGAGVHRQREAVRPRRARHLVPRSLPAHQGAADGRRPAAVRAAGGGRRAAAGAARFVPRATIRPTTSGTRTRRRRRCAGPIRRSCWCRGSACSASARTSRRRGWPASST